MATLGLTQDLNVRVSGSSYLPAPGGREASGGRDGVWLHRSLISGPDLRLGFIVYEEVAHIALESAGVPHGGYDSEETFWHELFAGWMQYTALVASGRVPKSEMRTKPIQDGSPYYSLGKHVGAALAGSEPNRRHIEEWDTTGVPQRKRRLVDHGLAMKVPLTVEIIADAYHTT